MDISSTSSEDNLTRDKRHERRRIKSAPSAKRIQDDFVKNLSDIRLETPTSAISTMPKVFQKSTSALPAGAQAAPTLPVGAQAAATPATAQEFATPAPPQAPATSAAGLPPQPQPVPGTSQTPSVNPYTKPPPTTLEETMARFQLAALEFSKVESNIHNMGNILQYWTPTLCAEIQSYRQCIVEVLRDVKYLAKFARERFNFANLERTLESKIKDMCIIYEICDNYLSRKPVQLQSTQIPQQQSPVPSRLLLPTKHHRNCKNPW